MIVELLHVASSSLPMASLAAGYMSLIVRYSYYVLMRSLMMLAETALNFTIILLLCLLQTSRMRAVSMNWILASKCRASSLTYYLKPCPGTTFPLVWRFSILKTSANAWTTSHRMHEGRSCPCRRRGSLGDEYLLHYLQCPAFIQT